jgi:hypothetical protein
MSSKSYFVARYICPYFVIKTPFFIGYFKYKKRKKIIVPHSSGKEQHDMWRKLFGIRKHAAQ